MSSNITLERLQRQLEQPTSVQVAVAAIQAVTLSPPISVEELRELLITELGMRDPEPIHTVEHIEFNNIYDFVGWYDTHREHFTPQQQEALDTLRETRYGIERGCACRRTSREGAASAYYAVFWTNNQNTDLPASVARAAGAARITFGTFCQYPVAS